MRYRAHVYSSPGSANDVDSKTHACCLFGMTGIQPILPLFDASSAFAFSFNFSTICVRNSNFYLMLSIILTWNQPLFVTSLKCNSRKTNSVQASNFLFWSQTVSVTCTQFNLQGNLCCVRQLWTIVFRLALFWLCGVILYYLQLSIQSGRNGTRYCVKWNDMNYPPHRYFNTMLFALGCASIFPLSSCDILRLSFRFSLSKYFIFWRMHALLRVTMDKNQPVKVPNEIFHFSI